MLRRRGRASQQTLRRAGQPSRGGRWHGTGGMPACARRNAAQLGPPRRGAGSRRWRRRIRRTEVADTWTPSLRHSPTIRTYPTAGSPSPSALPGRRPRVTSPVDLARCADISIAGPPTRDATAAASCVDEALGGGQRRECTRVRRRPDPCTAQRSAWDCSAAQQRGRCRPSTYAPAGDGASGQLQIPGDPAERQVAPVVDFGPLE
jgi:hypothetical protein